MKRRPHFRRFAIAAVVVASALAVPGVPAAASAATQAVATACATSRPHSGTILYSGITGGSGQLTIKNRPDQDGVVVLVRGRHKAIGVYVRARARATVGNIQDGTYTIYFTSGSQYSACQGRFTSGATYWRFNNHLRFATTATTFTTWTVTLYTVNGGNAPTTQVGPSDFPPP
ncbi:MAG TPA: hypothetical protein VIX15_10785 [Streptosporangiaceae bacterium]